MVQTALEFFSRVAGQWGLWIVFAVAFLETSAMVGLLVPGETVVLLAGALAAQGVLDLGDLLVVVAVAAILGDSVGYLLGRRLGREYVLRHPRLFRVKSHHFERVDRYFGRHGGKTIMLGRWVGFLRSLAPFIAGSARMPYGRFLLFNVVGGVTWAVSITLLGFVFGKSYHLVEKWLGRVSLFLLLFAVTAVFFWLLGRWLTARRAVLGELAGGLTDAVLRWRFVRYVARWFAPQIDWLMRRFSPRRAYGLGLTLGLVLSVLFVWLFAVLLQDVRAQDPITALDRAVALVLHDHAVPWLTSAMVVVTFFGSAWWTVAVAAAAGGALVWRRRWPEALVLTTATGGSALMTAILKVLVQRPRPDFVDPLIQASGYSFPSGHATAAVALYLPLGLLAASWVRHWENRVYVLLGAAAVVVLVGFSRLYLGVHYLTDVLAGYAVGAFWTTICITAATVLARTYRDRNARPPCS
ncbi:MAG: bifunctional DedA family/phosphatase PAP2 family protein [Actinobacteria bacterium]|nr:bifunctional DedA family/phosphatase PAP2 family protein [Actinomycetota bacterium]